MDGDEYVASGQTSSGHDIFVNTNTNSRKKHLAYYTNFNGGAKWFQSLLTVAEVAGGSISYSSYAISDSLCPPGDATWSGGSRPACKMGGPILTDHCAENNCHADADCTNTMDSFNCSCKSGFTGDGLDCTAFPVEDECTNGKNTCDVIGSTCTDTQYSYECACDAGFWDTDSSNPGRSCEGCCSSFELHYKADTNVWPEFIHGRLKGTCSLDTSSENNNRYMYNCDFDDRTLFYYLSSHPDLNEPEFQKRFHYSSRK